MRKDIEIAGYGIKKIYKLCKEANVNINYINEENDFTFEFSRVDRNIYYDDSSDNNHESDRNKISKKEENVLNILKSNSHVTKNELIRASNIPSRTLDRIVSNLKSKGLLIRNGSNKNGYWIVVY